MKRATDRAFLRDSAIWCEVEVSIGNLTLGQKSLELEVKKKAQTAQSFGDDPLPRDCSLIYSDCEPMISA
jgi:hypothetical protein